MRIQYAPLLYGRTFHVDFSSEFLAQPDFFTAADASYAFSMVRSSMDHSDFIRDCGRLVVFGTGSYAVTGLVITFEELFKKCGRMPMYNRLDHETGRPAYGFIGIVIPIVRTGMSKAFNAFDVPVEAYTDLYCELIAPRWNEKYREGVTKVPLREMDVDEAKQIHDANMVNYLSTQYKSSKTIAFGNTAEERKKLKNYVLEQALKGIYISFCSDADEIKPKYRKVFNVLTCENPNMVLSHEPPQPQEHSVGKKSDQEGFSEPCNPAKIPSYDDILEGQYHPKREKNLKFDNIKKFVQPIIKIINAVSEKK